MKDIHNRTIKLFKFLINKDIILNNIKNKYLNKNTIKIIHLFFSIFFIIKIIIKKKF